MPKSPLNATALVASLLGGPMFAQPPTAKQIPPELTPYIQLITSGQPEYQALVERLLTPQQLADYAPVIPYGVVLRNISAAPLRGYSLAFSQQHSGTLLHIYSVVDNAIVPLGILQPGQSVFYLPGVRVQPPALQPGQTGARIGTGAQADMSTIAQQLGALSPITASVEFVVTQAGKILGPDSFNDVKGIQASQQARMDLANRIQSHGNDTAGLHADLEVLAHIKVTDSYTGALRSSAQMLHAAIKTGADLDGALIRSFLAGPGSGIVISR